MMLPFHKHVFREKSMGGELDVDPAHRRGTFMTRMLYMVMDLTL